MSCKSHADTKMCLIMTELAWNRQLLDLTLRERLSLSRLQDCKNTLSTLILLSYTIMLVIVLYLTAGISRYNVTNKI